MASKSSMFTVKFWRSKGSAPHTAIKAAVSPYPSCSANFLTSRTKSSMSSLAGSYVNGKPS